MVKDSEFHSTVEARARQGLWLSAPSFFAASSQSQAGWAALSPSITALLMARHRGAPGNHPETPTESLLRLEKTSKIIKANHHPTPPCLLNHVPKCYVYVL